MIGEVIKEYLVSLGIKVDQGGFNQANNTINQTGKNIKSSTSQWASDFMIAGGIITTALASITASMVSLATTTAKQDLAMEKYARNMMVSKNQAREMKMAMDALGESVQDIQLTPELMQRYRALVLDSRKMAIGGDYEATMRNFRDLMFEFTRLKQEAAYALQWVGYYLMKYLNRPINDAKKQFKDFNDMFIINMSQWTEKIARSMVYIINIGLHFVELLKHIGKAIYEAWDAFPQGVKAATIALAGFFAVLRMSPIGRIITLLGSLLLLVDDYFGYMEGKEAALGTYWDKLNYYITTVKESVSAFSDKISSLYQQIAQSEGLARLSASFESILASVRDLGSGVMEYLTSLFQSFNEAVAKYDILDKYNESLSLAGRWMKGLVDSVKWFIDLIADLYRTIARSKEVQDFIEAIVELWGAFLDLSNAISMLIWEVLSLFFDNMNSTQPIHSFKDAIKAVVQVITWMIRLVSSLTRGLARLFKMMTNNAIFRAFWTGLSGVVKTFIDMVFKAITMVSKLGSAVMALLKGDFKKAASLAGEALSSKAEARGLNSGSFKGTGDAQRDSWIREAAKKFGVPESKIAAMIEAESSFDPNASSSVGATGYMQLMPETFSGMGYTDINDPRQNILAGTQYMKQLYDKYGDWDLVYAAYNAGPNAVDRYGGIPPYQETQNHVRKVRENEDKYIGSSYTPSKYGAVYSIQSGVEDSRLANTDPKLVEKFGELATVLNERGLGVEVSSGWRSEEGNEQANGVPGSKHTTGDAMDFVVQGNFDQDEISKLAKEKGITILYHDAGSGLHFHAELDPSIKSENTESTGGWSDAWNNLKNKFKSGSGNYDYSSLFDIYGGSATDYFAPPSSSGGSTVYEINVGGVTVAQTNASPGEIGRAVGSKTLEALDNRANYVLKNRALNGVPV